MRKGESGMTNAAMAIRNTNNGARTKRIIIRTLEYLAILLACALN